MKTTLPLLGLFASLPVFASDAATEEQYRLSVKTSDDCLVFNHQNCDGKRNEVRFETPNGYFISAEKFSDHAIATPLEETYSPNRFLSAHAHIDWKEQVFGKLVRLGKSFKPTDATQLNVELYIGQLSGSAHLSAIAEAKINPFTLTIPAFSYQLGDLPEVQFKGKSFSYAGLHKVFAAYEYAAAGKTPFGGLRESFGAGVAIHNHTHLLANQFAQAGVERISYGAGLGVAFASSLDSKIAQAASGICQGNNFSSNARFAVVMSACANKIVKDTLYDKLRDAAEPLTARINHNLDRAQSLADRVEHKTGYGYQFPHYNSADILKGLDIDSPYDGVRTSFVVAASVKIGQNHILFSRSQPLRSNRDAEAVTSVSLMRSF